MSGEGLALVMASMWVSGAGLGFIVRGWFRRKTIYGCGHCRETFKTETAMHAHVDAGCPLFVLERHVAEMNAETRRAIAHREAGVPVKEVERQVAEWLSRTQTYGE